MAEEDFRPDDRFADDFFLDDRFADDFLVDDRFREDFVDDFFAEDFLRFAGTFAPFFRASDRSMAIACSRLFTRPPCRA